MNYVNINSYMISKPYPAIKPIQINPYYASLLLDDYAGTGSEYTAVSQYIYGHAVSGYKKISDDFLGTAMVEMKHLELLADAIIKLGGNPLFINGCGTPWTSEFVPYGFSDKSRIELAIKSEIDAINQYQAHISIIDDPDICNLLYRLIEDEEVHIKILERDLNKYC